LTHIVDKDFTPAINKALELPGFEATSPASRSWSALAETRSWAWPATVIEAVKNKAIRHFFLVGGCDGAKPGRDYYTELVEKIPADCVVLTLACGKFRFLRQGPGRHRRHSAPAGRGQCNDAYSAIQIAVALAGAFECGVNDLPLSMILSWYEQKACVILLSLLHLGIKDIRLGPSLPAFITPNVLDVLVKNFNIMPIGTPDEDLKAILG
jgi:hydroxylamine reductase